MWWHIWAFVDQLELTFYKVSVRKIFRFLQIVSDLMVYFGLVKGTSERVESEDTLVFLQTFWGVEGKMQLSAVSY